MNIISMAFSCFAGGPIEDAIKVFTAEETGGISDISQGLTGGDETTSIGAMAEIIRNVGISLLPPMISLPLAGIVALTEAFQGDYGDALGAILLAVPMGKALGLSGGSIMASLKGAKSGIKTAAKKSKDLYKLYQEKGSVEFSKQMGTIAADKVHSAKNGYLAPFLGNFSERTGQLSLQT
jgi:hypothetical protein